MRIAMISVMMPWKENVRGTSALPYHLLVHRDKDIEVILYSFNMNRLNTEQINKVAKELNIKIKILPIPKWYNIIINYHLLFIRIFLNVPIGNYISLSRKDILEIKSLKPDGVWIYGEELSRVSRQFSEFKRVHTLPDSESLYYYRLLGNTIGLSSLKNYLRYAIMYSKYVSMEKSFDNSSNVHYHVVGSVDAILLNIINPHADVHFIRHPHYAVPDLKKIAFHTPKKKILIARQNNIYMHNEMSLLVPVFCNAASELATHFIITFLGHGWEPFAEKLKNAGWETKVITFAPDYTKEVCQHDIQIVPIGIGTGTKGKVLDALSAGLLTIGTPYAMENIAVRKGIECEVYDRPEEVVAILRNIVECPCNYEAMADRGRVSVLKNHSRTDISKQLFSLFK